MAQVVEHLPSKHKTERKGREGGRWEKREKGKEGEWEGTTN
jgi:hypothetical protein